MLAYVGLTHPHRFERTILLALAVLVASTMVAVATWLIVIGELTSFGPRAHFFIYLFVLVGSAIGLLRWPWLAATLLVLAMTDFAWGMGSFALRHTTVGGHSLLPPDKAEPQRFRWHVPLQAVPIPSLSFISATGLEVAHTSEGTRGRDPAPGTLAERTVIATLGGSSTYDVAVPEGDTWSDRLEEALGPERYFVVNHGVPGYTTVEHLIQTAFYLDMFGKPPRCAIYYVGWNDLRNAHLPDLDAAYADFHLPQQVDSLRTRRVGGLQVTLSPLLTVVLRLASGQIDTVQHSLDPYALEPVSQDDPRLLALYQRNIEAISAINRGRGVRSICRWSATATYGRCCRNSTGGSPTPRARRAIPTSTFRSKPLLPPTSPTRDISRRKARSASRSTSPLLCARSATRKAPPRGEP
jgi:hypothetical protein